MVTSLLGVVHFHMLLVGVEDVVMFIQVQLLLFKEHKEPKE